MNAGAGDALLGTADVILTRDLTGRGYTVSEVARMKRTGDLVPLRRGAYTQAEPVENPAALDSPDEYALLALRQRQLLDATLAHAVVREKLREDALRDLGWQVVRWIWAELFYPEVIAKRLHRAFARAGR